MLGSRRVRLSRGAVFAQQGYVVVAINPTGSTGFGQGKWLAFCVVTISLISA